MKKQRKAYENAEIQVLNADVCVFMETSPTDGNGNDNSLGGGDGSGWDFASLDCCNL